VDRRLLQLWGSANDRELEEILSGYRADPASSLEIRAALACLAEAGLLVRDLEEPASEKLDTVRGQLVSAVIVGYNSREWLGACLGSIQCQNYAPIEVVLVDNASTDGTSPWIEENYPDIHLICLDSPVSLAEAINTGVRSAKGSYYLVLNPDVQLAPDATTRMVAVAEQGPNCGAVAAKLRFSWAPAFLNGIGNFVGAISWGTDIGLGHLDLGQFDGWDELPSACFAGALIPKRAWEEVGEVDTAFSLYYEDSEWSYRARMLGWRVSAAPEAVIYHAFSGRIPSGADRGLSAQKLRQVVYGRLRFASKLLAGPARHRYIAGYGIEDLLTITGALLTGRWRNAGAVLGGWREYLKNLPALRLERMRLRSRSVDSHRESLQTKENLPVPLIWHGLPLLTWDLIRHNYLPLIVTGKTNPLPEFSGFPAEQLYFLDRKVGGNLERAKGIWQEEGFDALLHRVWKYTQRRLQV
jgi:GT2 family glycosyltransferase